MALLELFEKTLGKYIFILPQETFSKTGDVIPVAESKETYADNNQIVYKLSATEDFSKSETATVSSNPVSHGESVSDHYRWNDSTITFAGVISDSPVGYWDYYNDVLGRTEDQGTIVTEYIRGLRELVRGTVKEGKKTSPLVTIYLPDGNGEEDCVITNMNISRDNKVSNGYRVSITAKKIKAAITTVTDTAISTEYQKEVTTSSSTTTVDQGSPVAETLNTPITGS